MSRHYDKSKEISKYYGADLIILAEREMDELIGLCKKIELERMVYERNTDMYLVNNGKRGEVYKDFTLGDITEDDLIKKIASVMISLGAIGTRYMLDETAINKKINEMMNL